MTDQQHTDGPVDATAIYTVEDEARDERLPVPPELLRALIIALKTHPLPFRDPDSDYGDLYETHCDQVEVVLNDKAPRILEALQADECLWSQHLAAWYRLEAHGTNTSTGEADALTDDMIYAIATTPYVEDADGKHILCPHTFATKYRWFRGRNER